MPRLLGRSPFRFRQSPAGVGPPTTGTWSYGDAVLDTNGDTWVCMVAGTPGTWINPAGGKELAYAELASGTQDITSLWPTFTDVTGLSITFNAPVGRPYMVEAFLLLRAQAGAPVSYGMVINDIVGPTTKAYVLGEIVAANNLDVAIAKRRFAASSGSKTYKVAMHAASGDTVRVDTASALTPAYIRAWTL